MKEKLVSWLDLFLVIDVFLVIIAFVWFAIAVIGRYSGLSLGLDLWHKLWKPVFTPAIGILMGGAILSGIIKQITQRLNS